MNELQKQQRKQVTYGFHQISGKKAEDRGTMVLYHTAEGLPNVSSFGVFDGHFGTVAASVCAQHLHKTILKKVNKFQEQTPTRETNLTPQEKYDAIFCESARQAYLEIDEGVRNRDNSGTTGISVFMVRSVVDDSVRLYCSNVGDSRCVLFSSFVNGMDYLKDSANTSRSSPIDETDHYGGAIDEEEIRDTFYGSEPLNNRLNSKVTYAFPLNEDHKLSLPHERMRLETKAPFVWRCLPSNIVKGQMILNNALDESLTRGFTCNSLIEAGLPHHRILDEASVFVQCLGATDEEQAAVKPLRMIYMTASPEETEGEEFKRVHSNSFIAKRKLANGEEKGPEALFGLYNFSTNMTRSIGDRYGPRSCIALPDISAVTVLKDEYVRLVMASDGVWDVIKNTEVRDMVFDDESPEECAIKLVNRAHHERVVRGMRVDDITAIVIDINPELFPKTSILSRLSRKLGGSTTPNTSRDAKLADGPAPGGNCCSIA